MSEYEFTVSLRIRHPTIDPAVITAALGIQPQHTWQAGQARCDEAGAEVGGQYHESYWMGGLMDEPQVSSGSVSLEGAIVKILTHLRRAQSFLEELNAQGGVAELLVSLYARDDFRLELPSDSLTLLGRLHLAVALDVHPHSQPEAESSRAN
ncbi:MAG TPA: hypothetical protein VHY36_06160 [Steroidobacteraceae bacterium]|jgi:hypothetical protein|nr:hypothetical protein [Steroidobacteraceae bacterium]